MVKVLIVVAVLVALAAAIWHFASGHETLSVGIAPDKPIGDVAKIEADLAGRGLRKVEFNPAELRVYFGNKYAETPGLTGVEYDDAIAGLKHCIVLVKGPDGRLVAIASRFRSGAMNFSIMGTKCERFMAQMWLRLAGGEPKLEKRYEQGADMREYFWAQADRSGVTSTWRKEGSGGVVTNPQEMTDIVTFSIP